MLYPCMQCYAIPYVPQVRWIICSFFLYSLPSPQSSRSAPTFSTSKHAFTSFYSDLVVDFISSSIFSSCCRVSCCPCRESCVLFPNIIFIHITCLRMYSNMKHKTLYAAEEQEEERKTMKLLENLLCESE